MGDSDEIETSSSLYTLKENECAFSLPISNLSSGVGNNLSVGDTVSIIVNIQNESFIPNELKNLKVLSLTSSQGKETNSESIYSCITLLLNEDQAIALSSYMKKGTFSIALKSKG